MVDNAPANVAQNVAPHPAYSSTGADSAVTNKHCGNEALWCHSSSTSGPTGEHCQIGRRHLGSKIPTRSAGDGSPKLSRSHVRQTLVVQVVGNLQMRESSAKPTSSASLAVHFKHKQVKCENIMMVGKESCIYTNGQKPMPQIYRVPKPVN